MNAADLALSLRRTWAAALADFDLALRVRVAIEARGEAGVADEPKPWRAFAIGKAALAMLKGALDAGRSYDEVIVVIPEGLRDEHDVIARARAVSFTAAHPIPDERSERAGHALLALAARAGADGGALDAFVSGGASALACVPCAGVDLATKARVTAALLASGADVRAINIVRRHLSRFKGGGVLRAASPAAVHTFLVSDVLGGHAWDVGSGPTVVDPTTIDDARAVLARFAPEFVALPMVETVTHAAVTTTATSVADASSFATHLSLHLARAGFASSVHDGDSSLDVDALAREIADAAAQLSPGEAYVRCVEPALVVPKNAGRGGRATHLAAMLALRLPAGVACLVGATDGVDGGTETGGAVVTAASRDSDRLAITRSIGEFAAVRYLGAIGATLPGGPTGLNFADVVVLARAPRAPTRLLLG